MADDDKTTELNNYKTPESMNFIDITNKVSRILIKYPRFNETVKKIEYCHKTTQSSSESENLFIGGFTGVGKSTVCKEYVKQYPRYDDGDVTKIPVLMIRIPSPATEKGLVTKLLHEMGDPLAEKGSKSVLTLRLMRYIEKCEVKLIILDEFQHFIDRDSQKVLRTVTDWLKVLIEDTGVAVVLLGLDGGGHVNNSGIIFDANPQLSRRFAHRHVLEPFKFSSDKEIDEFEKFLYMFDTHLPLEQISNLSEDETAFRFYYATDGVVGYVTKLLKFGTSMALESKEKHLTNDILAKAFDQHVKSDKTWKINPFGSSTIEDIEEALENPKENYKITDTALNNRLRKIKEKIRINEILRTK
ncbi:MAG: TniB family NTP-binding protein [Candidatus Methanoperedens sp.]|nr:TniB family NTP-binding protein [Candidatus Methanoperedens sp.]